MKRLFLLLATIVCAVNISAVTYSENNLVFICFGQSNMLGKRYGAKMFEILKDKGYLTKTSVDAIPQESATETSAQPAIYNLNGQQLYAPVKGLNIINGKKYFIQ